MPERLERWYRRRRFILAYDILRAEGARHRAAGHDCTFNGTNETYVCLECLDCPWFEDPDDG